MNPNNERHIEDEVKEILAEGKRRQRAYEGIDLESLKENGGCVGTRKMPSIEEVEHFWTDGIPAITTYTPTDKDVEGLEKELRDLDRDAEKMEKHEGVRYE